MREAIYNNKMKWLTYWNSKNTQITINCYTLRQARKELKSFGKEVEQHLIIQNYI